MEYKIKELKVSDIKPDKNQPRKTFDEESLQHLAESILSNGLLNPIEVDEEGITFLNLCEKVRKLRDKKVGDSRIRHAISMHNRFGVIYGIYIKSDFGWIGEEKYKEKEWRYFVPKEQADVDREHSKLENVKDITNLKEGNLSEYEIKTIPQEKQLESLRQNENN